MKKQFLYNATRQCPKVILQLMIDRLISVGFSNQPFSATKISLKAVLNSIKHLLIAETTGISMTKKQQLLQIILTELIDLEDALYDHIRLCCRTGKWVQEYRYLQLEIKKLRIHIEKRWSRYQPADTQISKNDLLHYRCRFHHSLHRLRKRLTVTDPVITNCLLAPVLYCMQPGNHQHISLHHITLAQYRLQELEKATGSDHAAAAFKEEDAIRLLLQQQEVTPEFVNWYRQYVSEKCNKLPEATARISYLHTECARVLLYMQDEPGNPARSEIIRWLENYCTLIEKQAQTSNSPATPRADTLTKMIFTEAGGVVAEFYRMQIDCGFIKETDLLPLLETVAYFSELPFTRTPSSNYLYGEAKRKLPKNRQILLRYVNKYRDYLMVS